MGQRSYAVFETAIGPCALAWAETGVVGVQLPYHGAEGTRARVRERFGNPVEREPTPTVGLWIAAIQQLLAGEQHTLDEIVLDMTGVPPFHQRVYAAARAIPPGTTRSYGELAAELGAPKSARAVGQALGRNPFAIVVPCHRVLAANGKLGGFTAEGGVATKSRMLAIERGGAD
jgi:methylated-DNA-[protein]-cysteine S-methyltransferase